MFSAHTYQQRRARLASDLAGQGWAILPANTYLAFNYTANTFPFRQDSTFLYFTGLDLPGMTTLIDLSSGETLLFGHDPTIDDVIWEGPLSALAELGAMAGISNIRDNNDLPAFVKKLQTQGETLHFLPPYHAETREWLAQLLGKSNAEISGGHSVSLAQAVIAQRLYKSPEEVAQMEIALTTTKAIYDWVYKATHPGVYECNVVGGVEAIARGAGGGMAYTPIFSVNGQVLHNHYYGNLMQAGQWVVADLGAENSMHYAADLTRTVPVSGTLDERQSHIHRIVADAHLAAAAAMRPGTTYRECHLLANEVLAQGLVELGLLQGDPAEMAEIGVTGLFMPHGLGHAIGLDVHDMENLGEQHVGYTPDQQRSTLMGLKSLRFARKLEAGFTLTVEPGLYFIQPLIERWAAENKFGEHIRYERLPAFYKAGGCRIEDNYLITEQGVQKLGPDVPWERP
jgi:Xaa-Pro aminopeptidase